MNRGAGTDRRVVRGEGKAVDEVVQRLAILRGRYAAHRDSRCRRRVSMDWKRVVLEAVVDSTSDGVAQFRVGIVQECYETVWIAAAQDIREPQ